MHHQNIDTLQNDIDHLFNERRQLQQFVSISLDQSWTRKRDFNAYIAQHVSRNGYRVDAADCAGPTI